MTTIEPPQTPLVSTRAGIWVALLVAALALPIVTAPTLVNLTGWRLDSVISRSMIIGGGVVLLCWAGLPDFAAVRASLGWRTWRRLGTALAVTVACCAAFTAGLIFSGAEALRPELFRPDRIVTALGTGLIVSTIEEPVFRGVLLRRLSFAGSAALGSVLSSALYSYVHYIRPPKVASPGPYDIADSLAVYGNMADNLLAPLRDPVPGLGLFLLGLLLCAVVRRGGLAWTIGIHTGVVYYVKVDATFVYWMYVDRHWLFGSESYLYDGALFWIVCTAILGGVWLLAPIRRQVEA